MTKQKMLIMGGILIGMLVVLLVYQGWSDAKNKGIKGIPEQPEDAQYEISGNRVNEMYDFYETELQKEGWEILRNHQEEEGMPFEIKGVKEGYDGELTVTGQYNEENKQTEIDFDQAPAGSPSVWIKKVPTVVCMDAQKTNVCSERSKGTTKVMTDEDDIALLMKYVNEGIEGREVDDDYALIKVLTVNGLAIEVYYSDGREIILKSAKGTKLVQPHPFFLILVN